jgi:hypothetical protein
MELMCPLPSTFDRRARRFPSSLEWFSASSIVSEEKFFWFWLCANLACDVISREIWSFISSRRQWHVQGTWALVSWHLDAVALGWRIPGRAAVDESNLPKISAGKAKPSPCSSFSVFVRSILENVVPERCGYRMALPFWFWRTCSRLWDTLVAFDYISFVDVCDVKIGVGHQCGSEVYQNRLCLRV